MPIHTPIIDPQPHERCKEGYIGLSKNANPVKNKDIQSILNMIASDDFGNIHVALELLKSQCIDDLIISMPNNAFLVDSWELKEDMELFGNRADCICCKVLVDDFFDLNRYWDMVGLIREGAFVAINTDFKVWGCMKFRYKDDNFEKGIKQTLLEIDFPLK